jgi:hypothetical protein
LQVVFGFSKANALSAVWLYRRGKLSPEEDDMLFYLEKKPWDQPMFRNKDLPNVKPGMERVLEHLNYRITEAGGNPV